MSNVIIYARYSSDLQNDRSIEDQFRVCEALLQPGERILDKIEDRATSGCFIAGRPGIQKLLQTIEERDVSFIITEALDRLSRSLADIANIYSLASFHRVGIRTSVDRDIDEMMIAFKGTMNAILLKDMKKRIRRGQAGNIHEGRAGGGLAYGYRVKHLNDQGQPEKGLRMIQPDEARVVRSIYQDYANGSSVAQIVRRLNTDGIPSPRGGKWSSVTLTGHHGRGDGILQNAIYRGELVWGRCPKNKHPLTARRVVRVNNLESWVRRQDEGLRILDDELWFKVQKRRAENRVRLSERQRFSRFDLPCHCAECGGQLERVSQKYLICGSFKRHGTCPQNLRYGIGQVGELLFERLHNLTAAEWHGWLTSHETRYTALMGRLADVSRRIERSVGMAGGKVAVAAGDADQSDLECLKDVQDALGRTPHPSKLCKSAFDAAVEEARAGDRQLEFVTDCVESVSLRHGRHKNIRIMSIKPDFEAISKFG